MSRSARTWSRAPRVDVRLPAVMINSDGDQEDVIILDISRDGFRMEARESFHIGEHVTLLVGRGEQYQAQIRWVLGYEVGGLFLTPVDLEVDKQARGGVAMNNQASDKGNGRRTGEDRRRGDDRRNGSERGSGSERRSGDRRDTSSLQNE